MNNDLSTEQALNLFKEMADDNLFYKLTNGRKLRYNDTRLHRQRVIDGYDRIMNFIKRGISTTQR